MKYILSVLFVLFSIQSAFAVDRHVQKSGSSDANSCTLASPCLTVQRGINVLLAGETLYIHAGTYAEGDILFKTGGSSGARYTIRNQPGETPLIRPNNIAKDTVFLFQGGRNFITLQGLIIDGGDSSGGTAFANRLTVFPISMTGSNDITDNWVIDTEIRRARGSCILLSGFRWIWDNVYMHHCGRDVVFDHGMYFSGHDSIIKNSRFDNNACYNVQNYPGGSNNIYDGNTFTSSGCGVTLTYGNNTLFINNIMYDDAVDGNPNNDGLLLGTSGYRIYNNTLIRNTIQTINNGADVGTQIRNNIVCGSGAQIITVNAIKSNNIEGTCPTFVNAGANDYRLAAGSAAINAGITRTEAALDFNGVSRPQGAAYDIGAHEFTSASPSDPVSVAWVQAPPSLVFTNQSIAPALTVRVVDGSGATYTAAPINISVSKMANAGGGVLGGTLTQSSGGSGIATFPNLTWSNNGTNLQILAAAPGLSSAPSTLMLVEDQIETTLVFAVQPTSSAPGVAIAPPVVVHVLDQTGQLMTSATSQVVLSLGTNPPSGTLIGTLTQNAVSGVATFPDPSIATVGTGYRLRASSTGLTPADSNTFSINAGVPAPTDLSINLFSTGQFVR